MKNKFKKSKIIVPALALITATTVASVTGTVAWFTASRAVTISGTQFHTTTLDSNLKVKVEAYHEAGTSGANSSTPSDSGTVTVAGLMTHGSYAAAALQNSGDYAGETATNANLYTPLMDSDSVTGYESKGRAETNGVAPDETQTSAKVYPWKAGSKTVNEVITNIWYGVAWKMTFSIDSEVTGVINTLHFDPASSTFTDSSTGSGTKTAQGLRIAFMTTSSYLVAAGDDVTTHVNAAEARYEYVQKNDLSNETYAADTWFATNTTAKALTEDEFSSYKDKNGTNYGKNLYKGTKKDGTETSYESNIVNVNNISTMTYPSDGANDLRTNASYYYLGDITATTSLEVIAVAWFEGTDPAVVSTSTMSNVAASLKFFSRQA